MGRKQERALLVLAHLPQLLTLHTVQCWLLISTVRSRGIKHVDVCLLDQRIALEFIQVTSRAFHVLVLVDLPVVKSSQFNFYCFYLVTFYIEQVKTTHFNL